MKKIKDELKKSVKLKPSTLGLAVLAVLALVVVMIPLIRVAFYSVPWYDDYSYGIFTRNFLTVERSLKSAVEGAIYCVKTNWHAWQGTFSSIFLMALTPLVWGEDKYFLGALFLLALCLVSLLVFVKVLVRNVFGGDRASCVFLQATTSILVILLVHRSQVAFFWYNAGIHYVGMHSFLLLLIACVIRLLQVKNLAGRIVLTLASMVLALLVGGSNFVTALQTGIILISIGLVAYFVYSRSRKRILLLLPAMAVYGVAFYMNVTAPGNDKRADNFVGWGYGPVEAVLRSFVEAAKNLWDFTGGMTILILVLMAPVIWQMVQKTKFSFKYPGIVLLWSICLYATGFTPSLYALGHGGLTRTLNAVRITYQLLLVLNEIYWLGWLYGYLKKKEKKTVSGKVYWWFYPIVGIMMLAVFLEEPNKVVTYSSWGAYEAVHSGEAYNFYQQYLERLKALKGPQKVLEFEPYRYKPFVICEGDLSTNPEAEENRVIADWYYKKAISVKENNQS